MTSTPYKRTVHFELKPGPTYTLHGFRGRYELKPHTELTRVAYRELNTEKGRRATHFAEVPEQQADTIQLIRVYGPPDSNGIATLASMAVSVPGTGSAVYTTDDLAASLVFLDPGVTVLTAESAPVVLDQNGPIQAAGAFGELAATFTYLQANNTPWNTSSFALDGSGNKIPNPYTNEGYLYQYNLHPALVNVLSSIQNNPSLQAIVNVNNDPQLSSIRWNVHDGVPYQTATAKPTEPKPLTAATDSGYTVQLQDPGPNYGISAKIVNFDDSNGFTITIGLTNSYVRHCSAFVSFIGGDGKTAIVVPDNIWTKLAAAAVWAAYQAWLDLNLPAADMAYLFDTHTNTLKYLGTLAPQHTFLGVPTQQGSGEYTFSLPTDQGDTVSKIRVLVGSLGLPSGIDWDPQAAAIGIGMTVFFDILIPTIAIVATVGLPSSDLFETLFGKVSFFGPAVMDIVLTIWDIISHPDSAGGDLAGLFEAIANNLLRSILGAADVAAAIASVFGAEEAAEAVPIVGWALKAELIEATIEQLAQTIGEVVGSHRVVEFDVTVTMDVDFTLTPIDNSGFPETATSFTVTAQYSDVTGYVYTGDFPDPKVPSVTFTWTNMPVGGTVSFLVAFYSAQGDLVGKGQSAVIPNFVTPGQGALVVPDIPITQLLYPLTAQTTYQHQQVLVYNNGTHQWYETPTPPTETRKNLGTGEGNNILAAVTGISLNSDLGILGYSWEASSQNVPIIGTTQPLDMQVYTFQNISFNANPESALMFVSAGYETSPLQVYLRSAAAVDNGGVSSAVANSFFFLDPVVDSAGGYHLRGITLVTDPTIPPDSPQRLFNQSTTYSWGRFPSPLLPTSLAIHSNGIVVGVANGYDKLLILPLPSAAASSDDAPWSQVFCGPGSRPGLLSLPQQVAIAPNQTIYVLEAGNMRIQAFSRGGHPVQAFPSLPTPYWIPLYTESGDPTDITYAAMSVEIKGYIYVLSYEGDGYAAAQFRLDVYTPDGSHLLRQRGINAGSLTVDLWRNVFTQNFQTLLGPGNRTEPSVSEWIPSTPN
jgi:hypothetical protein